MKKETFRILKLTKILINITFVCFFVVSLNAQISITKSPAVIRESVSYTDTLMLGLYKTAFLEIKGRGVKSVNMGQLSEDIEIGQQDSTEVIMMKVRKPKFQETNLTVFLEDTTLQFLVVYAINPSKTYFTYKFPTKPSSTTIRDSVTLITNAENNNTAGKKPLSAKSRMRSEVDYGAEYALLKSQEKNIILGQVIKGKRIEARKFYVIGNRIFIGIQIENQWKGSIQISDIVTELLHTRKGNKSIIDADIEETAFANVNAFSKNELNPRIASSCSFKKSVLVIEARQSA